MLVTLAILGCIAVGLTYAVQSSPRVVPVQAMPANPAPPQTVIIKTEPLRVVVQAPAVPVPAAQPAPVAVAAASQPASAPVASASQPANSCGAGTKWDATKKLCVRSCQAAASQPAKTRLAKANPCGNVCARGTHCDVKSKQCVAKCSKVASASQPAKSKTKVAGKPPSTQPGNTKVAAAPKTKGHSPAPACTTGKCPKTPTPVDYTDATETYRATYR
jgi:hypothetical protein